jgi:hypothetical protein
MMRFTPLTEMPGGPHLPVWLAAEIDHQEVAPAETTAAD